MFIPTNPPADPTQFGAWAMENFTTLQRLLGNGIPYLILTPQKRAPRVPEEGMTVNADGVVWNPGAGAGLYQYLGGAWVKL